MSAGERLRDLTIGAAAGLTGGMFGVGGGAVLIPLLTGWAGLTQHRAHGTSLAAIAGTAVAGIISYALAGRVAWDALLAVGLAAMLTARVGARLTARLSGPELRRAFALLLFGVALRLLWRVPDPGGNPGLIGVARWLAFGGLGAAVGVFAAFFGVGGGILAVPAFTLLFGMDQQTAQGTSLGVILLAAPAGALEHSRLGNVAWKQVPALALGAVLTAPVAAGLALVASHEALARGFAVFLAVTAIHAWHRAGRVVPRSAPEAE